jgi:hypothetical protein
MARRRTRLLPELGVASRKLRVLLPAPSCEHSEHYLANSGRAASHYIKECCKILNMGEGGFQQHRPQHSLCTILSRRRGLIGQKASLLCCGFAPV